MHKKESIERTHAENNKRQQNSQKHNSAGNGIRVAMIVCPVFWCGLGIYSSLLVEKDAELSWSYAELRDASLQLARALPAWGVTAQVGPFARYPQGLNTIVLKEGSVGIRGAFDGS
eukprot:5037689-Amphidinium_carterae.1